MNEFKTAIRSAIDEYYSDLKKAISELEPYELKWQPSLESNSISWLLWHMARVEDSWVNRTIKNGQQLWISEKWHEKFNMQPEGSGYGQSPEEIQSFPNLPIQVLIDYYEQVHDSVIECLENSTEQDLNKDFSTGNYGPRKVSWIWAHIIVEESQHLGQIAYIRGMIRGINH